MVPLISGSNQLLDSTSCTNACINAIKGIDIGRTRTYPGIEAYNQVGVGTVGRIGAGRVGSWFHSRHTPFDISETAPEKP
jgi:hypothetical protein